LKNFIYILYNLTAYASDGGDSYI